MARSSSQNSDSKADPTPTGASEPTAASAGVEAVPEPRVLMERGMPHPIVKEDEHFFYVKSFRGITRRVRKTKESFVKGEEKQE